MLAQGQLFADRFSVETLAGAGGMGQVYRAVDTLSGQPVALKLLTELEQADRFNREARLLSEIRHPAVARYVAHGTAGVGEHYLAMEWLEGETLSRRLRRGAPLSDAESLQLARRVAEALGAMHARGIVHRDIKPGNLILVDNRADRVKVLDFGIAHAATVTQVTRTGAVLGTIGYMAPEQARGTRDIDARADVFALGAVLFRCLTGTAPFGGGQSVAVLAKLVLDEAPRLHTLRPDLPADLDRLLARMLKNDRQGRYGSGKEVADALATVAVEDVLVSPPAAPDDGDVLTDGEQRFFSLILALQSPPTEADETLVDVISVSPAPAAERPTELGRPSSGSESEARRSHALGELARRYGGRLEALQNGGFALLFSGGMGSVSGSATDLTSRAAKCALETERALGKAPIALATGLGVVSGPLPLGEVVDRAAALLHESKRVGAIAVDTTTAGLLDASFETKKNGAALVLVGQRRASPAARLLMGKPTTTVGRQREVGFLLSLLDECVSEPVARAAVVVGAPGIGKSRVRYEVLRKLQARAAPPDIWLARGDPIAAGSPFALLGQVIRRTAGVMDGESADASLAKLRARVALRVPPADVARVTAFLAELAHITGAGDDDPQLRAARRDPVLMGDQMRRAFEELVVAECSDHPVLLVLEDLHWGDEPTVRFVDAALLRARALPFMVLALARPELSDRFVDLWRERDPAELRLGRLTRGAALKLVEQVLGAAAPELVDSIVERADGNAFYLEELIRAVAEGRADALPETVLAMAQARIEALSESERRVLRAASVFGASFWQGAAAHLLGADAEPHEVEESVSLLIDREMLSPRPSSRFPGQVELAFRHALLKDAAYAMLTPSDLERGHRLAGAWLEENGEPDANVLAQHFERGNRPERAVEWYRTAANEALDANDFPAAARAARRGAELAETSGKKELLPQLLLVLGEALYWSGDHFGAQSAGRAAFDGLEVRSSPWFSAAALLGAASHRVGDVQTEIETAHRLLDAGAVDEPKAAALIGCTRVAVALSQAAVGDLADEMFRRMDSWAHRFKDDPGAMGRYQATLGVRALSAGRTFEYRHMSRLAAENSERAGDLRGAAVQRHNYGHACLELGLYDEAIEALSQCIETANRMGAPNIVASAVNNLGAAQTRSGRLDEARQNLQRSIHCSALRATAAWKAAPASITPRLCSPTASWRRPWPKPSARSSCWARSRHCRSTPEPPRLVRSRRWGGPTRHCTLPKVPTPGSGIWAPWPTANRSCDWSTPSCSKASAEPTARTRSSRQPASGWRHAPQASKTPRRALGS